MTPLMTPLQDTLYAKYILEREGAKILEKESGFIKYIINNNECFIADMFIAQDKRATAACRDLVSELEQIALNQNCEIITANIHLWDKGHTRTLMASIKCGFKVASAQNNVLLISKELKRGE